jgi:hypothetical protein
MHLMLTVDVDLVYLVGVLYIAETLVGRRWKK